MNLARGRRRAGDQSSGGTNGSARENNRVGRAEIRVVDDVEHFHTELQVSSLGDFDVLEK